jgi:hypothetical protein
MRNYQSQSEHKDLEHRSFFSDQRHSKSVARRTNFKQVWRKAVEKFSPKKTTKLNEVSIRFQSKIEEFKKQKGIEDDSEEEQLFPDSQAV